MYYNNENTQSQKKILIVYLGNIFFDTRCYNFFNLLKEQGNEVKFVGIEWLNPKFNKIKGDISIYKLKKKISIFFYLKFFSIILYESLRKKYDYYFAEDVYSLPILYLVAKIFGTKIYYDSREIYAALAGLKEKKAQQKFIAKIEKFFIEKVDRVIVTGEKDAEILKSKFTIKDFSVIRNLPRFKAELVPKDLKTELKIPENNILLLYQGVLLHHCGLRIILENISKFTSYSLVILGSGEEENYYKNLARELNIIDRVYFLGKIDQEKLIEYTAAADLGLSLIENASISYYYALPNKLFEYIMAEVPVIVSNLPQMHKVVEEYKVGFSVDLNKQNSFSELLQYIEVNKHVLSELKLNCKKAKEILNFENEFKKFKLN